MCAPGGRGLACTCRRGPVGGDGSQAPDEVVTEGAELRQRQVGRHLALVVTMETGGQVHALVLRRLDGEMSRLLHLEDNRGQRRSGEVRGGQGRFLLTMR
ncbi:hypothetical protein EYF80_066968 [Liparis tanakae]|uniref:Uncharacterized protein n=1 Tax=Liparis tanakae TaxID=230148 RepID=A0A4Z2E210_9TELE|nr:hypothetical protein EYF80_066968 [Liparis tanakae]